MQGQGVKNISARSDTLRCKRACDAVQNDVSYRSTHVLVEVLEQFNVVRVHSIALSCSSSHLLGSKGLLDSSASTDVVFHVVRGVEGQGSVLLGVRFVRQLLDIPVMGRGDTKQRERRAPRA